MNELILKGFACVIVIILLFYGIKLLIKDLQSHAHANRILYVTILVIMFALCTTYCIAIFCKHIKPFDVIEQVGSVDAWIGFAGSSLGGFITMLALYFTLKDSDEKMKKQINSNDMPYVKVFCFENPEQTEHFDYAFSFMQNEDDYDIDNLTEVKFRMGFNNIGKGPAINIKLKECSYKGEAKPVDINLRGNIAIGAGEKTEGILSICITFDEHNVNLLKNDAFPVDGAEINENMLKFKIQYFDIHGNEFIQDLTGRITFLTNYEGKIGSCTLMDFLHHDIEQILTNK